MTLRTCGPGCELKAVLLGMNFAAVSDKYAAELDDHGSNWVRLNAESVLENIVSQSISEKNRSRVLKAIIECCDAADKNRLRISQVPLLVRIIYRMRSPKDVGLGDTVQRIASWFGGEQFKWLMARLKITCGCSIRQSLWNSRWPY